jgi:predicted phosphoadenosine phosphosulfate sulfurtransferase
MEILSEKNVFDAALEHIHYLLDVFPNIVVGMSGGKDSTVVFELTTRRGNAAGSC